MTSRRRCVRSTDRPYSSGRWRNGLTTTTSPKRCPAWKSSLSKYRKPGAQLPESVYIELVQDLPTYRSEALIPQALQPFPRPRLLAGVGRVYGVEEDIRVYKSIVAGHEPLHGSIARQRPGEDRESSSPGQYSSVRRIWPSSMRPTSRETEVFSSAAFFRAQSATSSLTVIVMFRDTNSV